MNRILQIVSLLLVALAIPASADAATRYASPGGTGSIATCDLLSPCSLTDALSVGSVADGDEVILAPGSYTVASSLSVVNAVTVRGSAGAAATVINTSALYGLAVNNASAVVQALEIRHSVSNESALFIANGTAERVIAKSNDGNGCELLNGTIRDSICVTTAPTARFGLTVNPSTAASYSPVLRNVTVLGRGPTSSGIMIFGDSTTTVTLDARSVIARGNNYDVIASDAPGASVSTVNLTHSNFANVLTSGDGSVTSSSANSNQTADPVFVDPLALNFHQAAGSPTIDAGVTDGLSGLADVDGEARTGGSAADIGADEVIPPAGPGPGPVADTTPPVGRFVKKPRRKSRVRTAKFKFGSNEAGSTYRCKLDRGKYRACKSSYSKKVKPGRHTLRVIAIDPAGNRDATPIVWTWTVKR
jgi:hypothetical protein